MAIGLSNRAEQSGWAIGLKADLMLGANVSIPEVAAKCNQRH